MSEKEKKEYEEIIKLLQDIRKDMKELNDKLDERREDNE